MKRTKSYSVYIVQCKDGTLYTGVAKDLEKRIRVHNQGKGAKYTRARLPVILVYSVSRLSQSQALKKEWAIKQLSRAHKQKLIRGKKPTKKADRR